MDQKVRIGIIGCGGFARLVHVPNMLASGRYHIVGTCDLDLDAAKEMQAQAEAQYATDDPQKIFQDSSIQAVLITTRHDSHASLSVQAAKAGKHILCEKPMGLNVAECRAVAEAVRQAGVVYTIGYNRGMAPLVMEAKRFLAQDQAKKLIYHRIQAPFPVSHWIHDARIGGGRFIGEGCHIFDLLCELVEAPPSSVYASGSTFLDPQIVKTTDSGIVTLTFADGSVGTTLIASDGCADFPKEATEIYWAGKAILIENYQRLSVYGVIPEGEYRVSLKEVDKGHRREIELFADAILKGTPPPNGLKNAFRAALISFLAVESATTGKPMEVREDDYAV